MDYSKGLKTGLASAAALVAGSHALMAQSWDGMYAGLSVGSNSGTMPWADSPDYTYGYNSSAVGGLFVGTNTTLGNGLIFGKELAISFANGADPTGTYTDPNAPYSSSPIADAKFSLGKEFATPMGGMHAYGFAGGSVINTAANSGGSYIAFGTNFGLGAEVMVAPQFSVGVEVIQRNMTGYDSNNDPQTATTSNRTVSLRASYRF
ncbi:MAG: outer membrane beta-barrel protein [Limimaricola sp.]|uniref:outer membrane beta-barrel protein n=1 Tax=Limimaricola sp. TaxID=2211665 RepID=UPI001DCBCA70|nr:outer membrane beta-barrel protein [Limimaricola sp.]MBI1416606.1 outer membrane beta-barrel protein [Limimaricola sp.]